MLRNYLVIALRNIVRHKLYSFINIAGLAVGLACVVFIVLYLRDEMSYDRWVPDSQNVYRVTTTFGFPGSDPSFVNAVPFVVTVAMQAQIPEVVAQTHLIQEDMTAQVGERQFPATIAVVDRNFFQVIKLPLVAGDPATALSQPDSIVLSQTVARKFFGSNDPLGKTVILAGSHPVVVTGVLRDLPHNTQLKTELILPNTSKADNLSLDAKTSWLGVRGSGYVKLSTAADPNRVLAKLKTLTDNALDPKTQFKLNVRGSDIVQLHLTRFRDVHLAPYGYSEAGRWTTIYGFAAIAALILLVACFNFMNLATARAMMRAREVSLRKVVGARRRELIVQFLGESVLTALVALGFAFALVEILLPAYDGFLNRPIRLEYLHDWPLIVSMMAVAIAAGLIGGSYPALILSGFRPAAILGTGGSGASGSGLLRSALVVLQFAISIGLGVATIVVFAQIRYARQIDLGFDRHNLVVISGAEPLTPSVLDSLAQTIAADPAIEGVTASRLTPFDGTTLVAPAEVPGGVQRFTVRNDNVDPDFLKVYGMKLLAGRNLTRGRGQDLFPDPDTKDPDPAANILISATAARLFGYTPTTAVGRTIFYGGPRKLRCTIVGVVGDANFDGFRTPMQPIVFFYYPKGWGSLSVRIKPGQLQPALASIDRIWRQIVPTSAIHRQFQEESFNDLFAAHEREGAIFGMFVGVTIFIACLGLFGLAAFTAERRTREIGIRKAFGARNWDIVRLLLWQFSIPVLIANIIAWPVAWYWLHDWLRGFAYRIPLNPLYFAGAGFAALLIAWVTIFGHALRVARANPIHALRYE
jgi:putative ABC transport system permease protein